MLPVIPVRGKVKEVGGGEVEFGVLVCCGVAGEAMLPLTPKLDRSM